MNWPNAFFAGQTPQSNTGAPACSQPFRQTSEDASALALITKVMHALNSQPPLVLTQALQRDAFQMDHDKALRGNRAKAGRIAQEAKKATNRILAKGVCSNAKRG